MWPTSLGILGFPNFLLSFLFLHLLSFLWLRLTFYWACFQLKNFWGNIFEMGIFYYGVAKCSRKKFCCNSFTQISEHFCTLHISGSIQLLKIVWQVTLKIVQGLTLDSWYTNLEETRFNRCQPLLAPYKCLIHEVNKTDEWTSNRPT